LSKKVGNQRQLWPPSLHDFNGKGSFQKKSHKKGTGGRFQEIKNEKTRAVKSRFLK